MTLLYSGWGSSPAYQTSNWLGDLYVNPTSDLSLVSFVTDPDFGHAFRVLSHATTNWNAVNGKLFVGPLLKADNYPSAPGDFYCRVRVKLPDVGSTALPKIHDINYLVWEFESYPFNGPPMFSIMVNGDSSVTGDTDGVNHWCVVLDTTQNPRFAWVSSAPVQYGQWADFIVHYVVSKDNTVGGAELWYGGVQQTWRNGSTFRHFATIIDGLSNLGPHRLVLCEYLGPNVLTSDYALRFAPPSFGTTLVDVLPSAPTTLVVNPSFESDSIGAVPASWRTVDGTETLSVTNAWAVDGSKSCRVQFTAPDGSSHFPGIQTPAQSIAVTAGEHYTLAASFNVTRNDQAESIVLGLQWWTVGGSFISATSAPLTGSAATGTGRAQLVATAPATAAKVDVRVYCVTRVTGQVVDYEIDNVVLNVATAAQLTVALPVVGQTLTCSTGTWSNTPSSFTYQWKRDAGTIIVGSTASTYVTQSADVSHTLFCEVTASNTYGATTVASNSTGAVS